MIDLHSHILPGIDDGAPDDQTAAGMLEICRLDGVEAIVATPHWDSRFHFDFPRCQAEVARLNRFSPLGTRVLLGCELHLTRENLDAVLTRPSSLTLNGGDCLLLELSDELTPAGTNASVSMLLGASLRPVIAHPERNPYLQAHPEYSAWLVESGCYLQITTRSMLGGFGVAAQRAAVHLLRKQLVHFVASDAHNIDRRPPGLSACALELNRHTGSGTSELLLYQNPYAALHGKEILAVPPARRSFFAALMKTANVITQTHRQP